jgi:hypothetical protein
MNRRSTRRGASGVQRLVKGAEQPAHLATEQIEICGSALFEETQPDRQFHQRLQLSV